MKQQIELAIPPEEINLPEILSDKCSQYLKIDRKKITAVIPVKKSIDARSRNIVFRILVDVYVDQEPEEKSNSIIYNPINGNKKIVIVGFGPGGMFAALKLIELGIKPIIVERGKDVQSRRRDIKAIQQEHIVNPDSNYCFGEGGAGAYSDGKLYTRATKRGDVKKIMDVLIQHGADPEIAVESHPHIGSNRLPKIVTAIRQTIIDNGGEIYFNSKVDEFILKENKIVGVRTDSGLEIFGDAVILAAGHSARDIFYLLHKQKIKIDPKPFAMGVRIEHPQALINEIRYHTKNKNPNLPSAVYSLVTEVQDRGVYSFCMCPGGIIVPAATSPGEIVVNGMSVSKRNSPFANSGFVVEVTKQEWSKYEKYQPFAALMLQEELERKAFELANHTQRAPAQRVTDFVTGKLSSSLPKCSYIPGLTSASLDKELPSFISSRLRKALFNFDKKMHGYYTEDAVLVGVETRTSSPIRIPRDKETLMHTEISGLFPCGEGAGYAGGIVSAAIDGENCAAAVSKFIQ
ncbi:MAG TPA: FAD-binding protein [Ignavibacteriales bacterium]|nr:FAD-binding protein [Ignavibacteriales bacterium]